MRLTSPAEVKALLAELGVRPTKSLGQNFLIDGNVRDIIVDAAAIAKDDRVLEVGARLGVLTESLVEKAGGVVCVEVDARLCEGLRTRFGRHANLDIVCSDILGLDIEAFLGNGTWKVVSNLPYSVGSRVLMNLVAARHPPVLVVVTVQLEVAERLASPPGRGEYGLTSVWSQAAYDVRVVKKVSRNCFWPSPRVDSAVVEMSRKALRPGFPQDRALFYSITKYAFMHRRKQLVGIFRDAPDDMAIPAERTRRALAEAGLAESVRPGDISPAAWCALTNLLTSTQATGK